MNIKVVTNLVKETTNIYDGHRNSYFEYEFKDLDIKWVNYSLLNISRELL